MLSRKECVMLFRIFSKMEFCYISRAFNSPYALQKAKANVEQHYAVVGVLEELELSLKVLEKYVPLFFDGALDVYKGRSAIFGNLHNL